MLVCINVKTYVCKVYIKVCIILYACIRVYVKVVAHPKWAVVVGDPTWLSQDHHICVVVGLFIASRVILL